MSRLLTPLFICRHGEALPARLTSDMRSAADISNADRNRELTERGREQSVLMAHSCLSLITKHCDKSLPIVIVHSPYIRARQTAECLWNELKSSLASAQDEERVNILESEHFRPEQEVDAAMPSLDKVLRDAGHHERVIPLVVSHLPFVAGWVDRLTENCDGSYLPSSVEFSCATVALVSLSQQTGYSKLVAVKFAI